MPILSVRLSDSEYETLSAYAKTNSKSMNKALKDAFFEMLEEEYDMKLFDKAYAKYKKDQKTYDSKEIYKLLKI